LPSAGWFGVDRLGEVIQAGKDLPVRQIISQLYSAVLKFTAGTPQQDDLTAVIIKRRTAKDSKQQQDGTV
jgi:serine phosphatase RsbU (regulator of sigma subunit)